MAEGRRTLSGSPARHAGAAKDWQCDCGRRVSGRDTCPSCDLYNAAVHAQKAAAQRIAKDFDHRARDAWLNEHGVFAWIGASTAQVGTREQAAPFVALTGAARRVITFQEKQDG